VGELRRELHLEPVVSASFIERQDANCGIHVALDEVSAEAAIRAKGALQVYVRVGPQRAEIGAIERFLEEAHAGRTHLGEVCARWVSFDGDGGDAARFQRIHEALYPPDPLLRFFPGVKEWSGLFLAPTRLSEQLQRAMPGPTCVWLEQPAAELYEALRVAIRMDPDAIGVLRGDSLSTVDTHLFELLIQIAQTGPRLLVLGMRDEVRQAFRLQAERLQCPVQEPTSA